MLYRVGCLFRDRRESESVLEKKVDIYIFSHWNSRYNIFTQFLRMKAFSIWLRISSHYCCKTQAWIFSTSAISKIIHWLQSTPLKLEHSYPKYIHKAGCFSTEKSVWLLNNSYNLFNSGWSQRKWIMIEDKQGFKSWSHHTVERVLPITITLD